MERLASCYLDKMVTNTHWSLRAFRKTVRHHARNILLKRKKNNETASISSQKFIKQNKTADVIPTFSEFLEYILDTDLMGNILHFLYL